MLDRGAHQQSHVAASAKEPNAPQGEVTEELKGLNLTDKKDQVEDNEKDKDKDKNAHGSSLSSPPPSSSVPEVDPVTIRVASDRPGVAKFSTLFGTGAGNRPFSRPGQSHPDPCMPDVPMTPYFRYAEAVRPRLEAKLGPGVPKSSVARALAQGFQELPPEDRRFWDDDYLAAQRLYVARVHAYREAGNDDAWKMPDDEAAAWADEHGITYRSGGAKGLPRHADLPVSPKWPYYLWAATARESIEQELQSELDPAAWQGMSAGDKQIRSRSLIERESWRRWTEMSEEEKDVWREGYRAKRRLYEARMHAHKVGERTNAKEMTDEEATAWADEHGIKLPPLWRICKG